MPPPSPTPPLFRFPHIRGGKSWFSAWSLLFLVLWPILLVGGRSALLCDPGTFWHVAAGEKMLATGQVIRADTFSFTRAGKPWVADQWLAECGMALVHRAAGWDGLLLVTVTLLAAVYAWIGARLIRGGLHFLPAGLLLAMTMLVGSPQFHVRPLIGTIVLLSVSFGWLVDVENGSRRWRQLWWLIPLFILWANVHGGVLAGLGTVGLCVSGWALAIAWRLRTAADVSSVGKQLLGPTVLLLALAATTLASPYGLAMPKEWLDTLAMPLPGFIVEHAPLDPTEPVGWGTLALAAVYLATLIGVFPQRPRITWLVPLVWFVLALSRVRNAPLFAITAVIGLSDMLPYSRIGRWLQRRDLLAVRDPGGTAGQASSASLRLKPLVLPAILVVAAVLLQIGGVRVPVVGRGWAQFDSTVWPMELLPTLEKIDRASPAGTRIFNDMNFGGFLIYYAPRLRIFVDDRCPLYGSKFLLAYDRARREEPAKIDAWRQRYDFEFALVRSGSPFDRYLAESAEWSLVERAPAATLYRHS
jgi:hypothetical protein